MREKYGVNKEFGVVIESPHYTKQKRLTWKLRKEAREEDKEAEARRKLWDMKTRTPLLITLHKDEGRIPGGVRLQIDNPEVPRWVIYRRAATPTADLGAKPDAVIENSFEEVVEEFATRTA